ncbi:hypothetical protein SAMN05421788_11164 [Filimonas lacunae]|uniref:Uncharacterized protein n=1 Tax=Filimonas lacunae TaxID=477680 RepID=A0A173MAZ1_9BACT|nr:hypothetical protein [Filimonas lacunae]BAV04733.1 hypothetical protein FLA_0732 [Filimonas lacunae]SIT32241.1 hypothetical protein SAMN05421788_11164 [Filimonas lacunae]
MLTKEVPIRALGDGNFKIERSNDEEALTFLGFQASLRSKILARAPQASFITFRIEASGLKRWMEWFDSRQRCECSFERTHSARRVPR